MRSIWKGTISFGLVYIPVSLVSAEKKTEIRFNLLDSKDSSRIRYERVNEETGEEVPWDRIVKGYEYSDGSYVILKDEDFAKVQAEGTKAISIESFVEGSEINPMALETPYYLVPDKGADKPYALLREALKKSGKYGIARVVIRTKEYLAAVYPYQHALVLNLVRFYNELRSPAEIEPPKEAKVSDKELKLALNLIESMTEAWDPKEYKNEYSEALMKWIEEKAKLGGEDPKEPVESSAAEKKKVDDLLAQLEASIKGKAVKKEKSKA